MRGHCELLPTGWFGGNRRAFCLCHLGVMAALVRVADDRSQRGSEGVLSRRRGTGVRYCARADVEKE